MHSMHGPPAHPRWRGMMVPMRLPFVLCMLRHHHHHGRFPGLHIAFLVALFSVRLVLKKTCGAVVSTSVCLDLGFTVSEPAVPSCTLPRPELRVTVPMTS